MRPPRGISGIPHGILSPWDERVAAAIGLVLLVVSARTSVSPASYA